MIKNSKKFISTTLVALCIMSTVCSTGAFASETKTNSTKNTVITAGQEDVLGWHNVSCAKTYGWGTVTVPAKILVEKSNGKYYMSSEDYGTPIIQTVSSSDSATVTKIKDSTVDETTYKVEVTVSHKGLSPSFRVYFQVNAQTGVISAYLK